MSNQDLNPLFEAIRDHGQLLKRVTDALLPRVQEYRYTAIVTPKNKSSAKIKDPKKAEVAKKNYKAFRKRLAEDPQLAEQHRKKRSKAMKKSWRKRRREAAKQSA